LNPSSLGKPQTPHTTKSGGVQKAKIAGDSL